MQGRYQDTKSSQSSSPWITADVERSRSFTRSIRQRQPEATMEDSSSRNPGPQVAKRVRKAINCQPCRHSKIKCDRYAYCWNFGAWLLTRIVYYRDRPCSSCVLRGHPHAHRLLQIADMWSRYCVTMLPGSRPDRNLGKQVSEDKYSNSSNIHHICKASRCYQAIWNYPELRFYVGRVLYALTTTL